MGETCRGMSGGQEQRGSSLVCALIYERTTTPVSVNVQQDDHMRKRANTNKMQWNVREHNREYNEQTTNK